MSCPCVVWIVDTSKTIGGILMIPLVSAKIGRYYSLAEGRWDVSLSRAQVEGMGELDR